MTSLSRVAERRQGTLTGLRGTSPTANAPRKTPPIENTRKTCVFRVFLVTPTRFELVLPA